MKCALDVVVHIPTILGEGPLWSSQLPEPQFRYTLGSSRRGVLDDFAVRSDIYDAVQALFRVHDVLTTSTLAVGNPAAAVPAGIPKDNLPLGMQIIDPRSAELDVIAASAMFEQPRPSQRTYAKCKSRSL
jgi:hypothetical protein